MKDTCSKCRICFTVFEGINKMLGEDNADSLRGVSVPMTSPYKMWKISKDKRLIPILKIDNVKEPYNMPRQKLPQVWAQNGVLEVIRKTTITIKKSMTGDNIIPLVINNDFYVDIDNKTSFDLAEELIKNTNCVKP